MGVVAMLAPGLFVWANFVDVPEDAAVVEAVGQQWHWRYRFPGKDGKLGTVDAKHVSDKNPFGIVPDDPDGQDDLLVSSQELHLPLNRPIKLQLRSLDVLHNFAVPQFRAKMDLVPGLVTYFWVNPTRTGKFDLLCNELCGVAHYAMRGKVVVEEESAFQAWLGGHPTFAQTWRITPAMLRAGKQLYATVCCLSWRARRGQSCDECAEIERAGRLVPATATEILQAGCPRNTRARMSSER